VFTAYVLLRWGTLRHSLSWRIPYFDRVLLIESGSRYLYENLLPGLYASHPELQRLDVLTCFQGAPRGFDAARGDVYHVQNWQGRARRKLLYEGLRDKHFTAIGMICSGEPIMTRWKWTLAVMVPSKYFLLNENGDYVWFDRTNWRTLAHFALFRMGLAGADAVSTLGGILFFPFTFAYLLSYAAWAHLRRKLRTL
jgi:hypothetical protein